ncbi:hypothetical protein LIA77_08220 [Sarocladium implicatum]|nr:hypothetical protein LIA77_08220 [Sarocladium implicatum]
MDDTNSPSLILCLTQASPATQHQLQKHADQHEFVTAQHCQDALERDLTPRSTLKIRGKMPASFPGSRSTRFGHDYQPRSRVSSAPGPARQSINPLPHGRSSCPSAWLTGLAKVLSSNTPRIPVTTTEAICRQASSELGEHHAKDGCQDSHPSAARSATDRLPRSGIPETQ